MELFTNFQKCISGFFQISFSIHLKQHQSMELIRINCNNEMVTQKGNLPLQFTEHSFLAQIH